jgi:tRNA splicing endonuclease
MDDSYFICADKEQARRVLAAILPKYAERGIIASPKKTHIVKLSRGFTFLKTHFSLEPTGRIVVRPSRESAVRQRRKIKKFKKFYDAGEMTLEEIRNSYMSWRGFIAHTNSRRTVQNMDELYKRLFGISPLVKIPKK